MNCESDQQATARRDVEAKNLEVIRLVNRLRLPNCDLVPADLFREVEAHNSAVGQLRKRVEKTGSDLIAAADNVDCAGSEPFAFTAACQQAKIDRVAHVEEISQLAATGEPLAESVGKACRPLDEKAKAEYAALIEKIKADLTSIGQGLSATMAGNRNQHDAERQFESLASMNDRARAARESRDRYAGLADSFAGARSAARQVREETATMRRKIAAQAIASV